MFPVTVLTISAHSVGIRHSARRLLPGVGPAFAVLHNLGCHRLPCAQVLRVGRLRGGNVLGRRGHVCHHLVHSSGVSLRRVHSEAGRDEGSLIHELHHVAGNGAVLVAGVPLLERLDDGAVGVDLHDLAPLHVFHRTVVAHSLRLHDALHVGAPPHLGRHQDAGRVVEALRHHHLLHLVTQSVLHPAKSGLQLLGKRLHRLLLLLRLLQLQVLLGHVQQVEVTVLAHVGHRHLIDWLREVQHLIPTLHQVLHERRRLSLRLVLRRHEVDRLLPLLHPLNVLLEADLVVAGLGGVEADQVGQNLRVVLVLDQTQLEVTAESLKKCVVLALVLVAGELL
mmetsp:Transcript_4899/g.8877  ORF Transcript_4899/g.8877 Transcript_4899/m.8877 type:complete len:337 (+) Transcript_4899:607-1617(+)